MKKVKKYCILDGTTELKRFFSLKSAIRYGRSMTRKGLYYDLKLQSTEVSTKKVLDFKLLNYILKEYLEEQD